jgi:hypothetical protein
MKNFIIALLSIVCFEAIAQSPARVSYKGQTTDTTGNPLAFATIMLLQPKDSALVNFSRANDKGEFEFKSVKNQAYILKVSYVGSLPYQQNLGVANEALVELGRLKIKPIAKELIEVVVKTARAPLSIKGDTIEYNAASFKVPVGSTVEDLLRRLPGIQVDADGNIKAQGKDVKKVLVDGKIFFGSDPKAATRNLGAETISKVQVYNDKTEQAKLTGVDDGKKEKAINLELKEEFKKGAFGKVTGAVGTDSRHALRGNYNRFNPKEQFSVLGYQNNINETGVNWNDYGEFKGNNANQWDDSGDFGFSAGNDFVWNGGNGDIPRNNFDGRGFTKNFGSGLNYNYNTKQGIKESKFSSSYFYNQTDLDLNQFSRRQTFLPNNNTFFNRDTITKQEFRGNHSVSLRFENTPDSSNTILAKSTLRFSNSDVTDKNFQNFLNAQESRTNRLTLDNTNIFSTYNVNGVLIFRHKFKKKGRNFAVSSAVNFSGNDGTENLLSVNRIFAAQSFNDQIRQISQRADNQTDRKQIKGSLSYTEPMSKKVFWETFGNLSFTNTEVGRGVIDRLAADRPIDTLNSYFRNNINYSRMGTSLRYSYEGVNVSVGVAGQNIGIEGSVFQTRTSPQIGSTLKRNFFNVVPNFSTTIEFKNNAYLSAEYGISIKEPQINDLQPITNLSNPIFVVKGNPNLNPERSHSMSLSFNKFDPGTFSYLNIWGSYNYFSEQIVYTLSQELNQRTGLFQSFSSPINVGGGSNANLGLYSGFPIVKTKFTVGLNGNLNFGRTPTFLNGKAAETTNQNTSINLNFDLVPSDKIFVDIRGSLNFNNIEFSADRAQNQKNRNHSIWSSVKWNFAKGTFFETTFKYDTYENDRFGFRQELPIWNASIRKLFLKENKLEVRLAAFDLLNRRQTIIQNGSQNFVSQDIAPTLARYFMLSFTYNVKGMEGKLKKNNFF